MVVIDIECDCSEFGPVTLDPVEIMYILYYKKHLANVLDISNICILTKCQ